MLTVLAALQNLKDCSLLYEPQMDVKEQRRLASSSAQSPNSLAIR